MCSLLALTPRHFIPYGAGVMDGFLNYKHSARAEPALDYLLLPTE